MLTKFDNQIYYEIAQALHANFCCLYHYAEPEQLNNPDDRLCKWEAEEVLYNKWDIENSVHALYLALAKRLFPPCEANKEAPQIIEATTELALDLTGLFENFPDYGYWLLEQIHKAIPTLSDAPSQGPEETSH